MSRTLWAERSRFASIMPARMRSEERSSAGERGGSAPPRDRRRDGDGQDRSLDRHRPGSGRRRRPAEIISADSRQVYRGLDIGTAKASAADRAGVPHHGLDLVEPDEPFTLADFAAHAREALAGIASRGAIAILVGGTGLYLRAVARGLDTDSLPSDAACVPRSRTICCETGSSRSSAGSRPPRLGEPPEPTSGTPDASSARSRSPSSRATRHAAAAGYDGPTPGSG